MQNQKEAYYAAITNVMSEAGVDFEESVTPVKPLFNTEMKEQVLNIVCEGFKAGTIILKDTPANQAKLADPAKLREYAKSTLHNWILKDPRLNGGIKHEIKNKGSRAGQGDKLVKNYKALLATGKFTPGSDEYNLIETKLKERQEQIRAEKQSKKVEVNYDLIPADLREELGI